MENNHPLPIVSFATAQKALDCSRSFLYVLINEGKLKPKYLGKKPYFLVEDIMKALTDRPA